MGNGVDPDSVGHGVGDKVAARFTVGPRGALGEYAVISPKMTDKVPGNLSSEEAAALGSSGTIALCLSRRIKPEERVLIIGAGGGVGSHLCQILRIKGIKYIAGVSCEPERLLEKPISCDGALDYTKNDVYNFKEWEKSNKIDEKFDTVIDLAGGGWLRLLEQSKKKDGEEMMIIKTRKEGGRYLTMTPDEAIFELHGVWAALKLFLFTPLYRALNSRITN